MCKLDPLIDRVSDAELIDQTQVRLIETVSICKTNKPLQYTPSDPRTTALIPNYEAKATASEELTRII